MPPKKEKDGKAAPAKKKKDPSPEDGGPIDVEAQLKLATFRCNALEVQLADRTDEASKALIEKREMQKRLEQLTKDYDDEKKNCLDITQVMTRDYKGMQVELLDRISKLEETILSLRDKLSTSGAIQGRIIKEKDAEIQRANDTIHDLNTKIDDMAEEFSQMLKETLDKMKERIDVTSSNFDVDDTPLNKRMEGINLANSNRGRK